MGSVRSSALLHARRKGSKPGLETQTGESLSCVRETLPMSLCSEHQMDADADADGDTYASVTDNTFRAKG